MLLCNWNFGKDVWTSYTTKFDTLEEMKEDLHRQMDSKPVPSEYASKIVNMLDGYIKLGTITNEL